jgi:gamma-glutamyltranspeptidase/glutathione hydrolase
MVGQGGAAVAPQVLAVEAAADILASGGSAMDAAVAAGFVQGVVDPVMCGPGGYGTLLHWDASTTEAAAVDGSARAGSLVRDDQWASASIGATSDRFGYLIEGNANEVGYTSIGVPGTVDLLGIAHERWGRIPWLNLLERAIDLAEHGFVVTESTADFWSRPSSEGRTDGPDRIRYTQASAEIFAPDGNPLQPGQRLVQRDHAEVLRVLAKGGRRAFYEGELAEVMGDDIIANGGTITAEDLGAYHARFVTPMTTSYRGRTVIGVPRPLGGPLVSRALAELEKLDVKALRSGTAAAVEAIASAIEAAGAERLIESPDTTQLCVVDADGNAVSLTHSLGSSAGVVTPSLGFQFNNYLNCFNPLPGHPDSLTPGGSRESNMAPTIVVSGGRPNVVTGSPGATRIPGAVVQVLVNVIDFAMTPVEAVSAARIDRQPAEAIHVEGRTSHAVTDELERRGHEVVRHAANYDRYFGRPQLLVLTDDGWRGAADPRGDGADAVVLA